MIMPVPAAPETSAPSSWSLLLITTRPGCTALSTRRRVALLMSAPGVIPAHGSVLAPLPGRRPALALGGLPLDEVNATARPPQQAATAATAT